MAIKWNRHLLATWLAAAASMLLSSSGHATPVSEFNGLPEAVRAAAVSEAVSIEAFRFANRKPLQNCVLSQADAITANVVTKLPTVKAEYVTEELIAREIGNACFGKKQEFPESAERYLLVSEFFNRFSDNLQKANILRIGVGTQAALDLLNGEKERGDCIIKKFLVGAKAPAMVELTQDLTKSKDGPTNVEPSVIKMIDKHCGSDAYTGLLKTYDAVASVLDQKQKEVEKELRATEAKLEDMRRHANRVPDGRLIFQTRARDRWYFEDGKEAPAELVRKRVSPPDGGWEGGKENPFENNAKNLSLIFGAFEDNEMVIRDNVKDSMTLGMSLGSHAYRVERAVDRTVDPKGVFNCYFDEFHLINGKRQSGSVVSYVDIDCDGTLDSSNLTKVVWPTNADHKKYQKLLAFLTKFVPVTESYKTHLTPPDTLAMMLNDFQLGERNRALLAKIMGELEGSDIRDMTPDGYLAHFVGNAVEITFVVEHEKERSISCVVAERAGGSYVVFHDDGCQGSVTSVESSDQKNAIRESDQNPMFYDMLRGLERLTNLGMEVFPKR